MPRFKKNTVEALADALDGSSVEVKDDTGSEITNEIVRTEEETGAMIEIQSGASTSSAPMTHVDQITGQPLIATPFIKPPLDLETEDGDDDAEDEARAQAESEAEEKKAKKERDKEKEKERLARLSSLTGSSTLSKYLPSAERVRVHKRETSGPSAGHMSYIGDYDKKELEQSGDIRVFIKTYIVPSYRYGEYIVELVKADGKTNFRGTVTVAAPFVTEDRHGVPTGQSEMMALFDKIAKVSVEAKREAEDTAEKNRKMVMDMVQASTAGGGRGMDPMMLMFMTNQMQISKPSIEPTTALVEAMKTMMEQQARKRETAPFPIAALPPLPDFGNHNDSGQAVVGAMVEGMKMAMAQAMKPSDVVELIAKVNPPKPERTSMSVQEIIALVTTSLPILKSAMGMDRMEDLMREIKEMKETRTYGPSEAMQQMVQMKQFMQEFTGGRDIDNFWNTLNKTLDKVPDIVESIRKYKVGAGADSKQLGSGEKQGEDINLTLPAGFGTFIQQMIAAEDDPSLIGACLEAMKELMKSPSWKKHMEPGMKSVMKGDKKNAMEFVTGIAEGLRDGGHIPADLCIRILKAFDANFEELSKSLRG